MKHDNTNNEVSEDILDVGGDIIDSERFEKARSIPHHFDYDVAAHSLDAAECALLICRILKRLNIPVEQEDAIRASLLHDLGMTEDEVFLSPPSEKAYTHPEEGARIATEEYGANEVQIDAILHHMWPIGHIIPHHTSGWILVAADKMSSIRETGSYAARQIAQTMQSVTKRRKDT